MAMNRNLILSRITPPITVILASLVFAFPFAFVIAGYCSKFLTW